MLIELDKAIEIILKKKEGVREDGVEKIYFCEIEIQANVEAAFKKDDNFQFDGYSNDDKIMMINHILPYFEKIEEYEICKELKNEQN